MLQRISAAAANLWPATLMAALTVLYLIETLLLPRRVKESLLMVGPVGLVILAAYTYMVAQEAGRLRRSQQTAAQGAAGTAQRRSEGSDWRKFAYALGIGLYVYLAPYLRFELATALFTAASLYYLGGRRPVFIAVYSLVFTAVVSLVFFRLLDVPLPMLFLK